MKELRLHGRGGQGVVTSAEIIVHAAVEKGFIASCFPFFGFEKKGGPVEAYVRVSKEKSGKKALSIIQISLSSLTLPCCPA